MKGYLGTKTPANERNRWQTPKHIFDILNQEFNFDCDVAADENNHLVDRFISERENALSSTTRWGERNFVNPPYDNIAPWVSRCIEEKNRGNTSVLLVPADTSVKWFRTAWNNANEIRFVSGRINFVRPNGTKGSANNKGSVIFVFRGNAPENRAVCLLSRDNLRVCSND